MIPELKAFGPPPIGRMVECLIARNGVYGPDLQARTENEGSLAVFRSRGGPASATLARTGGSRTRKR